MYKTVRHGENSLQYTILPQTEEVLNNGGLKGKGRDYSPSIHIRRSRKESSQKICMCIFLCILCLVLILSLFFLLKATKPIFVQKIRHSQRHSQEVITASPVLPTEQDVVKSRKKELRISPYIPSSSSIIDTSTTSLPTITSPSSSSAMVTSERATTPPWTRPALKSWKSPTSSATKQPLPTENTNEVPLIGTPSGSVRLLDHYMSANPWEKDIIIRPTVTPEPIGLRNLLKYYSHSYTIHMPSEKTITTDSNNNKMIEDVLITTKATTTAVTTELSTSDNSKLKDLKDAILSVDDDEDFKESLEVDEVFSLPPLKPDPAVAGSDSDEVTVSKTSDSAWYGARWPFVDTSSYFQWTGYSPGDNLLLPLLIAALSSICLVLLLALAVKRRKRKCIASAKTKTGDFQVDANTNLLTAENPEEAEE